MLAFVAHEARMRAPADKEGRVSVRTALTAAAARGVESAIKGLASPPFPEALEYLWDWFMELDRTRTTGFNGPDPITYPIIESWARLMDRHPSPTDVELLLQMDLVMRHPDAFKEPAKEQV
jgi:hypothetical protein